MHETRAFAVYSTFFGLCLHWKHFKRVFFYLHFTLPLKRRLISAVFQRFKHNNKDISFADCVYKRYHSLLFNTILLKRQQNVIEHFCLFRSVFVRICVVIKA